MLDDFGNLHRATIACRSPSYHPLTPRIKALYSIWLASKGVSDRSLAFQPVHTRCSVLYMSQIKNTWK